AVYTWTYNASGTGQLIFNGNASGTDANTGLPAGSPATDSNTITINTPASLGISLSSMPAVNVGTGAYLTVILTVTNTGQSTAINVVPQPIGMSVLGLITLTSGPTPANASIAGGASSYFTWVFQGTAIGGPITLTSS